MPLPNRPAVPAGEHSANPVRWARAQAVFHAALDLPEESRAAYIEEACVGDIRLRDEVESLLSSDARAGAFIEEPAAVLLARHTGTSFSPRFHPGDVVGRYEVLAFLGAGGISEVYRAHDSRLGRDVALKIVTDPRDGDAGRRLLTEAQHASILNHPNICAVYEAENGEGMPFIVLELIEGPTLHETLTQRRITLAEAVKWASDIAAALHHAHRRGIIHRDLKSVNVALASDGTVKVLDFGLSRRIDVTPGGPSTAGAILTDASVAGTLTHIAPEVLRGEPLDHRVDIWALGVMLYEMVTGVLPFKGQAPFETARAILETAPAPVPSHVPLALRRVIERCLEKDPSRRFTSAEDVRQALRALQVERPRPYRLHAMVAGAAIAVVMFAAWWSGLVTRTPTGPPVLAVAPFDNASGDLSEAFFADGVTEAVVGELGRIDGVRVIGAASALRTPDPERRREVMQSLGVTRLVDGDVRRDGSDVQLRVRLTDASTGRVLWAQEYRRSLRDVQALHAVVASEVARGAQVELSEEDARHFGSVRAVAPDVYEAYLKGRYYWNQRTTESIRTAVTYFEAALKLDPTYAPAYAALADCYNQLGTVMVGGGSPREWRPKAADAAIKALQIDPTLSDAHATLGYVRHYEWQWTDAEVSFRRAIELNPSNALARIWYANFLCSRLRLDEAIREVMIARDLDPLSLIITTNVGWVLFMARRTDDAIEQYTRALALDPTYMQAQSRLAGAYLAARRFEDALTLSAALARATNQSVGSLVSVEQAKMLAGRPNDFERLLDEAVAHRDERYLSPGAIANYYFSFGGRRDADGFRWLEQAFRERTNNIAYLAVEPVYDRVRAEPRFRALVAAASLP